jgi:hypothetical protein
VEPALTASSSKHQALSLAYQLACFGDLMSLLNAAKLPSRTAFFAALNARSCGVRCGCPLPDSLKVDFGRASFAPIDDSNPTLPVPITLNNK